MSVRNCPKHKSMPEHLRNAVLEDETRSSQDSHSCDTGTDGSVEGSNDTDGSRATAASAVACARAL